MEERELAERIWGGGDGLTFKNHYETIKKDMIEKINEKEFAKCVGYFERVQMVQKSFNWINPDLNHGIGKSAGVSSALRGIGNEECRANNLTGGLRAFNLAIGFGRVGSEELSLAHFNRSAILISLGQNSQALKDLQFASSFPISLKSKLEERREKCQRAIQNQPKPQRKNQQSEELAKKFNSFFEVEGRNEKLISAAHFVQVEKDEKKGRKLIVVTNVPPGTTLISEKPYAKALENELSWEDQHCHFCFKRILAPIPCNFCTFGYFCNEKCRERISFHEFEHDLYPFLLESSTSQKELVAIRMITTLGPLGLTKLYKLRKTHLNFKNSPQDIQKTNDPKECKENVDIELKTFISLFNLTCHSKEPEIDNCVKALYFAHLIFKLSKFPSTFPPNSNVDSLLQFTACLILRHLEVIPFNLMSLNELRNSDDLNFKVNFEQDSKNDLKSVGFGTAIFETLSLANHSCAPNAIHIKGGFHGETSLINVSPLEVGEEICINYGPIYTKEPRELRREILKEKYHFHCECGACEGSWQTPTGFDPKMRKSVRGLDKFEKSLHLALELVKKNELIEALRKIQPAISFFHSFQQPFFLSEVAKDLLKKAIIKILYFN